MISRETENVQSSSDVEAAFRALTSDEKPYITSQELFAVSRRPKSTELCETNLYYKVTFCLLPLNLYLYGMACIV